MTKLNIFLRLFSLEEYWRKLCIVINKDGNQMSKETFNEVEFLCGKLLFLRNISLLLLDPNTEEVNINEKIIPPSIDNIKIFFAQLTKYENLVNEKTHAIFMEEIRYIKDLMQEIYDNFQKIEENVKRPYILYTDKEQRCLYLSYKDMRKIYKLLFNKMSYNFPIEEDTTNG
jgi:hypothetical protein